MGKSRTKNRKQAGNKTEETPLLKGVPEAARLERSIAERAGLAPPVLGALELLDYAAENGVGPEEVLGLAADELGMSLDEAAAKCNVTDDDLAVCLRQLGITRSSDGGDRVDELVSALRDKLVERLRSAADEQEEPECSE